MSLKASLLSLCACLRGDRALDVDWWAVLRLANHTLLTPALHDALSDSGQSDAVPRDVASYLLFVRERNGERNARLRKQLAEAVATLNQAGLTPLLLKGAVRLFTDDDHRLGSRITGDLDLSLPSTELDLGKRSLAAAGYGETLGVRGLMRAGDIAVLELRAAPDQVSRGIPRLPPLTLVKDGVSALLPTPTSMALHWLIHDLIKEGDYWRGRIDLRHLYDVAVLASNSPLNWSYLRNAMPGKTGRNAFAVQILALHELFAVARPAAFEASSFIMAQHRRRLIAATYPFLGAPLRAAGDLLWGYSRWQAVRHSSDRTPTSMAARVQRTFARPHSTKL